jgi:hypothetical protein
MQNLWTQLGVGFVQGNYQLTSLSIEFACNYQQNSGCEAFLAHTHFALHPDVIALHASVSVANAGICACGLATVVNHFTRWLWQAVELNQCAPRTSNVAAQCQIWDRQS